VFSGDIYNRRGYVARMETRIGYGRIIQVEILFLPQKNYMKNKKLNKIISKAVSIALESFKKNLTLHRRLKSYDDYNYVKV
jgi:ABC-type uncharacterized transport system fused permease/ATPase subunit